MALTDTKPIVLAIDDTPENLDIVSGLLINEYQVRVAPNGIIGLKIAKAQKPDLILLDIMMPEIDGYEVCRRLKADPETAGIPVIFLTAKGESTDQTEGFELGAADYILKPVDPPVLLARVRTHITLKQSLDQLSLAKAKMEDELNVGQRIQLSMLPTAAPVHPQFSVYGAMRAARQVGGDLYDYFFVDEHHFCVCVADVSDKGVPASLFMAVSKTLVRACTAGDRSTASIVTRINDELARDNEACMFVTLYLAIFDLRDGTLRYTNAGHNPPYIKRASGSVETLSDLHGPVAGAMDGLAYRESEENLHQGDQLFVFTDGVSEAMDRDDGLFGEARIVSTLEQGDTSDAKRTCETVLAAVDRFVGDAEQSDDITLLALQILEEPAPAVANTLRLVLKNDYSEIDRLNDAFNEYAETHEVPMAVQLKTNLVFDELINNVISYGFADDGEHEIIVSAQVQGGKLVIHIDDDGKPFNPFQRAAPNTQASLEERDIGGLGIHLVKEVMDEVQYRRQQNFNRVTLIKNLEA